MSNDPESHSKLFQHLSNHLSNHLFRHHGHGAGHRGFGHGHGFMGEGGRGGFRTGRKLGAGDLQLLILALLAEKPSHGYELIKALEERSGGFYVPSPGMIYPALTFLEETGDATVEADGAKKLYRLTDAGQKRLEEHRPAVDAMLEELARIGGRMDRVRQVFAGEDPAGEADDDHFEGPRFRDLHLARRALRMALREKRDSSPREAKRIVGILRRAIAEILDPA